VVSNAYDALSRRVLKVTPTETRTFLYDGWNMVREEVRDNATGFVAESRDYYWGRDLSGSLQGAGGVGGLLAYTRNGALRVPVYDLIGNVVAVVDDSGVIVDTYEYDPFGNIFAQSGAEADDVPFRFSTKCFDSETGLYYYGYRFYSPELGRWINRDPVEEEGGDNLYAMCRNHPLMTFDTDGRYEWTETSATEFLRETINGWKDRGWGFAAQALESFVNGTERNVNLSQYSGDISSHWGWQQAFIESVSSKLGIGDINKRIGDIEHEANFGKDLSNEDFNHTTVFHKQFEYRFHRIESGNLFYALYGSRYSYTGTASKSRERVNGRCCTKIDLNLALSSWDALTYPPGLGREYFKQYSAARYLESFRASTGNRNRFVPYIYLLWNENGQWIQCTEQYRGGARTGFWRRTQK
jgi:RHS repeat-associated protein